jgi:hypothetical protein
VSFVGRFRYDVFISYAHADNVADLAGSQWVSMFVRHLDNALRQRLGGADTLEVYFDQRNLHSNSQLEELLDPVRSSAIFLAIASRSYAVRPWPRQELDVFTKSSPDLKRLFAVECLPLDAGDAYPPPLNTHKRMQFWRIDEPHSSVPMPISPSFEPGVFFSRVHDLAERIRLQLLELKSVPSEASGSEPAAGARGGQAATAPATAKIEPDPRLRRVLLAQVTDDLEDHREQVRRYLGQYRVAVLPDDTYPQGGAEFMQAFTTDLARTDLFVQLLGASAGRRPPDLAQGYTRFQYEAAVQQKTRILQWRQPDLDPRNVASLEYRNLLSGPTVIASGLEGFKAEVLRQASLPETTARPSPPAGLIFIDADRKDADVARIVQDEFKRHRLSTIMPAFEGSAEAVRADLEENLIECDALVLVYGDTTPLWVRGQLRLFNKIKSKRAAPPKILAIYSGPPEKAGALGISIANAREIDCGGTWAMEALQPLIQELQQ